MSVTHTHLSGEEPPPPPKAGDGFEGKGNKYVVCGVGRCGEAHGDGKIWCVNEKDCPRPNRPEDPCQCVLLRARKTLHRRRTDIVKWEADPDQPTWDAQGQLWKYPYDAENYWYTAVCARKL